MSKKNLGLMVKAMSQELSYDHFAKEEYSKASKRFLRSFAKDLGLEESKVTFNPGGPAVSGDPLLMGMWGEENGVYVSVFKDVFGGNKCSIMYRTIKDMKDYTGGSNCWISEIDKVSYDEIVEKVAKLHRAQNEDVCA